MVRPSLEEVRPTGRAAEFVAGAAGTFFVVLRGVPPAAEDGLCDGDVLEICSETDAEPGDLVVWWAGSAETLALARVGDDLALHPVAGFPAPLQNGERCRRGGRPALRGVVVGRLRRQEG